jgi:hypothetical protein
MSKDMNAWQELVKMALLGTDKMPLQTAVLPQNIQNLLSKKADDTDKEAHFLKAAALTLVYWKAGQIPDKTPLPDIAVAPDETLPFAPPQYVAIFKRLLDGGTNKFTDLYFLLFEKIKHNNYVLPHENLFDVLSLLEQINFKQKKTLITDIIGERGLWLQQFNAKWQTSTAKDADDIWQEGTSAERRAMLFAMRQNDPNSAFLLMKSTWDNENARERKEFMKILSHNPQPEEWIFMQMVYDELSDAKAMTKTINQDIRTLATTFLLGNPDSNLYKSVVERLKNYVVTKKKFLGLQSTILLEIPTEEDAFLNKEVMKTEFGHADTPSTNELLTEYWFTFFLQNLHPITWETLLGTTDWQVILKTLDNADKQIVANRKRQRGTFRWRVSLALSNHAYRAGILACLETGQIKEYETSILNTLTNEELENYFLKNIDLSNNENTAPRNYLIRDKWRWSKALSQYILRGLIKDSRVAWENSQFAVNSANYFDDCILPELYDLSKIELKEWHQQHLNNQLVLPLIQFLELRKQIENL